MLSIINIILSYLLSYLIFFTKFKDIFNSSFIYITTTIPLNWIINQNNYIYENYIKPNYINENYIYFSFLLFSFIIINIFSLITFYIFTFLYIISYILTFPFILVFSVVCIIYHYVSKGINRAIDSIVKGAVIPELGVDVPGIGKLPVVPRIVLLEFLEKMKLPSLISQLKILFKFIFSLFYKSNPSFVGDKFITMNNKTPINK